MELTQFLYPSHVSEIFYAEFNFSLDFPLIAPVIARVALY